MKTLIYFIIAMTCCIAPVKLSAENCPAKSSITLGTTQNNVSCYGGRNGSATVYFMCQSTGIQINYKYTYNWTPSGGTGSTATGLSAGTYTVTVTDFYGNKATAVVTITQPSKIRDSLVTAMHINVSCNEGNNGSVVIGIKDGTPGYAYTWSPNVSTGSSASNLSAGTYIIAISDTNGCAGTKLVTQITQPTAVTATVTGTNILCYGGFTGMAKVTASGGTLPYTYAWSTGATTSSLTSLGIGNYTVTVTDAHGCTATGSHIVTQPTALSASITSQANELCNEGKTGSVTVIATGGTPSYTYSWTPSYGNSATAVNMAAGAYAVTVKDKNQCSVKIEGTITQPNKIRDSLVAAMHINVSCNGENNGSVVIGVKNGTPGYAYTWSPNVSTDNSASNLSAGTYSVAISDINGCAGTTLVTKITQPALLRDSISAQTCSMATSGTASVGVKGGTFPYTYSWAPLGHKGGTTYEYTQLPVGSYTVTITDKNKCEVTATATIDSCKANVPIHSHSDVKTEDKVENKIALYPNPNMGQFALSGLEPGATIEVYNTMGVLVRTIYVTDATSTFNVSDLANGIYLLRIISKDGNIMAQPKMLKTR